MGSTRRHRIRRDTDGTAHVTIWPDVFERRVLCGNRGGPHAQLGVLNEIHK